MIYTIHADIYTKTFEGEVNSNLQRLWVADLRVVPINTDEWLKNATCLLMFTPKLTISIMGWIWLFNSIILLQEPDGFTVQPTGLLCA